MVELLCKNSLDIAALDAMSNSDLGEVCKQLDFPTLSR